MGVCWCKEKNDEGDDEHNQNVISNYSLPLSVTSVELISPLNSLNYSATKQVDPAVVDRLVLETLDIITTLVDNEQDPPPSMLLLHGIADNEEGFIQVIKSLIKVVPLSDPLGPSIITLLLDDCPLPSKESVFKVVDMLGLSKEVALSGRCNPARERNVCVVLGCIAETLAGPRNLKILNDRILDYLITNLEPETHPSVTLFSLIALEKLAQSSQNKATILKRFEKNCPIVGLDKYMNGDNDYIKRQVGFCAQWILDNLFVLNDRIYSYLTVNMDNINAMLNTSDVSEYLKISPDGLEARCDAYSFESVRCTAQADSGVWYYEAYIVTPGVMQIGWATKNSNFLNHDGYGIGDDKYSIAYDGCRKLTWYNAKSEPQDLPAWKSGDVLGCLLDLNKLQVIFSLNGVSLPPTAYLFSMAQSGFFAAASFMSFQQCKFNFGADMFKYPPTIPYSTFNQRGKLEAKDKVVIPRHIFLKQLRLQNIREDSCTLCYDQKASVRLKPCNHSGFCLTCIRQLIECPMCRAPIELVLKDNT